MGARSLVAHDVRCIAVEAMCDPRTVERFLRGLAVKDTCALRVRSAMRRLGLDEHIPDEARGAA